MDDVLGQLVIMLNLLLIAVLMWPMCRDSWRDKESHNLRLVTVTVLAIIPLALMVLTATGYFYHAASVRSLDRNGLSGDCMEPAVPDRAAWFERSGAPHCYRRAVARRQHQVKEGLKGQSHRKSRPLLWSRLTSKRCVLPCW